MDEIDVNGMHVVAAGPVEAPPVLFVHGWPESWQTWRAVMELASSQVRAIAVDLPGIGGSAGASTDGSKRQLAEALHGLIKELGLREVTLVGHDAGGMAAYRYLRQYDDVARVVVMDTVVPGVEPWTKVLANPYIWHFGWHAVPELPEKLVQGNQAAYFDYFYDVLSPDPARITPELRAAEARAYATNEALTAGFDWYRTFRQDAADNQDNEPVDTPLLYLRGEHEMGDIDEYAAGFRAAGVRDLRTATIPGAGHFAQADSPAEVWRLISAFIGV